MPAFTTASAEETEALGARLARLLERGDVVAVAGELGAGTTTFIRGACRALGVTAPVTSPTYALGHRYEAPLPVSHLDLYRIDHAGTAEWGDLEPYLDGTITFVEWPEHAGAWLPATRASVAMAYVEGDRREIRIEGDDDLLL